MLADGLTNDKAEPSDLLRACIRHGVYQLADEVTILARAATEQQNRESLPTSNQTTAISSNGQDRVHRRVEGGALHDGKPDGSGSNGKEDSHIGVAVCGQVPSEEDAQRPA